MDQPGGQETVKQFKELIKYFRNNQQDKQRISAEEGGRRKFQRRY